MNTEENDYRSRTPAAGTVSPSKKIRRASDDYRAVFYTLNGTDPRAPGGNVAVGATAYTGPITVNSPIVVFARARHGTAWSGASIGEYFPPQDFSGLRITELNYNPPAAGGIDGDEFEFIELKNSSTNTLDLSGLSFRGVGYSFPNGAKLAPGAFWLLTRNANEFAARYPGIVANGVYTGGLENTGEALAIDHSLGTTILSVPFDDAPPWPAAPDGHGFTLVASGTASEANSPATWRASAAPHGTPGTDDVAPAIPGVVINELRSAGAPQPDAVELFNPTSSTVDLSGWWLTDDRDLPQKFAIPPGTSVPAGGYVVFTAAHFGSGAYPLTLADAGGEIYLFSATGDGVLTGYTHGVESGGAEPGVSFGRFINSAGLESFTSQLGETFGGANTSLRLGPVVISEIHYHPDSSMEFVELKNLGPAAITLHDGTNPWRLEGVGFEFGTGTTIEPNGTS